MHYLDSAPKSPPQSQKPDHFYNYAKRNPQSSMANPYSSNPMRFPPQPQTQQPQQMHPNPYQANQLAEDHTIEDIEQSSRNGGSKKLLTIMLIGLFVVILLGGLGIAGYFLFRHKSKAPVSNKTAPSSGASTESGESGDSDESGDESDDESIGGSESDSDSAEGVGATAGQSDKVLVHQLYFQNEHVDDDILGYIPTKPFIYTQLDTLETIAGLMDESSGWKAEKLEGRVDNDLHHGLCEYLQHSLIHLEPTQESKSVHLCGNRFKLHQPAVNPLGFIAISAESKQHTYSQGQDQGVTLSLYSMIYSIEGDDTKLYVDTYDEMKKLAQPQSKENSRRRLAEIPSRLPKMSQIAKDTKLRIQLPANYRGKNIQDLQVAIQAHHNIHVKLGEHDPEPANHQLHYKLNLDHSHNAYNPRHHFNHHDFNRFIGESPTEIYGDIHYGSREARWNAAVEDAACIDNGESLAELEFIEFKFTLKIGPKETPAIIWECEFRQDRHVAIHYNKQWLSNIAENRMTECTPEKGKRERKTLCEIVQNVDTVGSDERIARRRLPAEECECHRACDRDWESLDDGKRLILLECDRDSVSIDDMKWELKSPTHIAKQLIIHSQQHDYQHPRDHEIFGRGVPFPRCPLIDFKDEDEDEEITDRESEESPAARRRLASPERAEERRRLVEDYDASGAGNKHNMYMLIGSAIFCVMIGIQSFYWLSTSY